jgi:cytoskeletal protein CcmA (bactofilin family)
MLGRDKTALTQETTETPSAPPSAPMPLLDIVGSIARMEGTFEVADSIRIDCSVGGHLNVGRKLVIGELGDVKADVKTMDATIMGEYEGNLIATGNVEITATGRVTGTIQTDSLVINKGGFFNGNVRRMSDQEETRTLRPVIRSDKRLSAVR